MKKMLFILSLLMFSVSSKALIIKGSATIDNGNQITIDYVFEANQIDVFTFDLFFDMAIFDNIQVTQNPLPTEWETLVLPSDPFFGEDGLVNFLSLGAPIGLNTSLSGFQIVADFIGSVVPENFTQQYEVLDPNTFSPVVPAVSGLSTAIEVVKADINAPSILLLFFLSLCSLVYMRKRRNPGAPL